MVIEGALTKIKFDDNELFHIKSTQKILADIIDRMEDELEHEVISDNEVIAHYCDFKNVQAVFEHIRYHGNMVIK